MNATVLAMRRAAPHAAIVFVTWLKPDQLHTPAASRYRAEAAAVGVDVVDVPAALRHLPRGFYARNPSGSLDHHPNKRGHELLGRLAARCIAQRLGMATPLVTTTVGNGASPKHALASHGSDLGRSIEAASTSAASNEPPAATTRTNDEVCYLSAPDMPVSGGGAGSSGGSSGFELVDDGGSKGVRKLGYSSTRVGDRIKLGPLNLHHKHGGGCHGKVRVRIGYLVSTHPGQGAFNLRCVGCACRPIKSSFLRRVLPFPRLETSGRGKDSPLAFVGASENVSITSYTLFIATLPNASASTDKDVHGCHVDITHERSHGALRHSPSRVRLDSLAINEHDGDRSKPVPCAPEGRVARPPLVRASASPAAARPHESSASSTSGSAKVAATRTPPEGQNWEWV